MISTSFASCTHHLLAARLTSLAADDPVHDVLSRHDSRVVRLTPLIVIVCRTAALHFKHFLRDHLRKRECTKGLSAVRVLVPRLTGRGTDGMKGSRRSKGDYSRTKKSEDRRPDGNRRSAIFGLRSSIFAGDRSLGVLGSYGYDGWSGCLARLKC